MKKVLARQLATGFGIARGLHFLALHRALDAYTRYLSPQPLRATPLGEAADRLVLDRILGVFKRDAENIAEGLYPARVLRPESPREHFSRLPELFRDAIRLHWRRASGQNKVFSREARDLAERSPEYLRRNFHFQTDGYFSEDSARFYDTQVEVLFAGTAAPMRRRALEAIARRFDRSTNFDLLEIACGSGVFTRDLALSFPEARILASDVSPAYVEWSRKRLGTYPHVEMRTADACALDIADASMDIVVAIYLFHELPLEERRRVLAEARRVLRPGGRFVLLDSLQFDDVPEFNPLLEDFPINYHEPFYANYCRHRLEDLFREAGFCVEETDTAFLSKLVVGQAVTT
jgi:ubiquinone/menaquinone biosynthesis C-methylase UbiE